MSDVLRLLRAAHPEDAVLDLAITHALLRGVGNGEVEGAVARVFRPGPTMAFGRLDVLRDGYAAAVDAARGHGFEPVLRLGGGHAAAYDQGSVIVEIITPQTAIAEGMDERFRTGTALLAEALVEAGVRSAEVGELPGEYCPGQWSVHGGSIKLAGTAQRSIRGASLLAAVVLAQGGDRLRDALVDVYAALGLNWDPATAGAAEDLVPGLLADGVLVACVAALGRRWDVQEVGLDTWTLELARGLMVDHQPGAA